jgi:DNA-binding MarR family transcriptional regulator
VAGRRPSAASSICWTNEEGTMKEDRRPIGYWLKHLDGLINENFERTLAGEGVDRRQWQALNTLHERPSTQAEIAETLKPFLVDDPGADRRVIDELTVRGWVRQGDGNLLELTPAGVRAHAALLERIQSTRQLLVRGVTQEEYLATIGVLRRMAENLERPGA